MNYCEYCDAKQGNRFVHRPEGPFGRLDDVAMDAVAVVRLEAGFLQEAAITTPDGPAIYMVQTR